MEDFEKFEATVMPNEKFKGRSVIPDERVSMQRWFEKTQASTNVMKPNIVERHVFDMKYFKVQSKKSKALTFINLFRMFAKTPIDGNADN